jgi:hypothetical protein
MSGLAWQCGGKPHWIPLQINIIDILVYSTMYIFIEEIFHYRNC